jgi:hypothetical protein
MPDATIENDSPPGAPAYASGPLAVKPVPTAAAFRASGQSDLGNYLSPPVQQVRPVVPLATNTAPPLTFGERAASLLDRATSGIQDLLGITPKPTPPIVATSKTAALETDLNDLEKRSTPKAPSPYAQRMAGLNQ